MKSYSGLTRLLCAGLIWGSAELTLGSFLHAIHSPYKGVIMTGIGLTIISIYLLREKNIWHPILIGVIAGAVKSCGTLLWGIPLWSRAIINPVTAILTEATAVSLVLWLSDMLVNGVQRTLTSFKKNK